MGLDNHLGFAFVEKNWQTCVIRCDQVIHS